MKIYRPLQTNIVTNTFEFKRKFYFCCSASLATDMLSGTVLLDIHYQQQLAEYIEDGILPDTGHPKACGEYLCTGSFYPDSSENRKTGLVKVSINRKYKELLIFPERKWALRTIQHEGLLNPTKILYTNSYGGKGYDKNPEGIGYEDGLLPYIEHPANVILAPGDCPEPAGFGPLGFTLPQRTQFQGSFDQGYMKNYFPGLPADFDWHYFNCAPDDQWIRGFWSGDELFQIYNMHPEHPVINGTLPGLTVRCFIQHTLNSNDSESGEFAEIPLHLDTIWLFPEKLLALQIWRGVIEVADDEASQISHLLAAYENCPQHENQHDQPGHQQNAQQRDQSGEVRQVRQMRQDEHQEQRRTVEYYRRAFEKRLTSKDPLLASLKTADLIPPDHKSAMEILLEQALAGKKASRFGENLEAKTEAMQQMVDEKVEEAIQHAEKSLIQELPAESPHTAHVAAATKAEVPDVRSLVTKAMTTNPDPNIETFKDKLDAILPGIAGGDPKQIELKNFSFDKIDQIMTAVDEVISKKEQDAKTLANEQIQHAKDQLNAQLDSRQEALGTMPEGSIDKLRDSLKTLEAVDLDAQPAAPLPRLKADDLLARFSQVTPQLNEAMQHLQTMKAMGIENEQTARMEQQVQKLLGDQMQVAADALKQAEADFKKMYIMGAHFMETGLSPHKAPVDEVRQQFFQAKMNGEDMTNRDWSCIDLQGQDLSGINLSGCFLEQVDFSGATLKGADLSGAILARAILNTCDLSDCNLEGANIGGVTAHGASFIQADLKGAKLSRGDFTGANFTAANLAEIESLEIIIDQAIFDQAIINNGKFIERAINGTSFKGAQIETAVFYNCSLDNINFSGATMPKSVWADCLFEEVCFDGADISSNCFVATDDGKSTLKSVSFAGASLDRGTFMNLELRFSNFSSASMEGALFNGSDLSGADLTRVNAKQARFRKTNLNGARLDHINLAEGSLAKAQLTNASFRGANLYGVDCLRCQVGKTDFTNANLDATLLENGVPE